MGTKLFKNTVIIIALAVSMAAAALDVRAQDVSASFPIDFPVLSAKLSSKFGPRVHPVRKVHRHHGGVDLVAPAGSHVRSVTDGVVVFAGKLKGYGKLVTVRHANDTYSLYGHLSEMVVNVGSPVKAGQVIGRVGKTGLATGNHLHF
ncbi:MAG: M23 family metallopeptidase, partial [Deltaproteobacteria bacterium]|nr:M23 family metallopeptidase [Deltaproteobacteria bacterium]